ncbi:unnamed protein product [Thlaspi arvense]|uniref:F-box/LRR-repeat protein 15/At3g58940/PEG3-like LRR domain-containing protein n=1 Tax=Thlaspi arvense TaxID=13288 RepID=A0AAU9T7F2_THLAR|nr:unnamed protein product [Thlaspi arvense]
MTIKMEEVKSTIGDSPEINRVDNMTDHLLSKQWEFLWMWLPKLEYSIRCYSESESKRLQCFLNRNLPLHRAPVIESFRLSFFCSHLKPEDIKLWVLSTLSRLRRLEITCSSYLDMADILPSSLYTCKPLVTLKLKGKILVDVPRMVCLPSLKTLRLEDVTYFNGDSLRRLLSICPVLENLMVDGSVGDNMGKLTLRTLVIYIPSDLDEFVINTPSLKYLKLDYFNSTSHYCLIESMPKLKKAYIDVAFPYMERLIGSITSVKHLTLCLVEDDPMEQHVFGDGFVFNKLVHLRLCTCDEYSYVSQACTSETMYMVLSSTSSKIRLTYEN